VQEFISKWRTGLSRLHSANFPFSVKMCINQFICGLPNNPAFNSIRSDLPNRVTSANDRDLGAFIDLTEKALELDTIFKSILPPSRPRVAPPSSLPTATSTPTLMTSSTPIQVSTANTASGTLPYSAKLCTNCGRKGHLVPTCFEPGGGMEGRRAEFKRDRSKVVAMLLADLDESLASEDVVEPPPSPMTPTIDPLPSDTLDDHILVPTMANLSVSATLLAQNDIIHRDIYHLCEPFKSSSYAFQTTSELNHTAYLSLGGRFNSCLDSGCTDHIITDRRLFHTL
jgi:hypothetical protein